MVREWTVVEEKGGEVRKRSRIWVRGRRKYSLLLLETGFYTQPVYRNFHKISYECNMNLHEC